MTAELSPRGGLSTDRAEPSRRRTRRHLASIVCSRIPPGIRALPSTSGSPGWPTSWPLSRLLPAPSGQHVAGCPWDDQRADGCRQAQTASCPWMLSRLACAPGTGDRSNDCLPVPTVLLLPTTSRRTCRTDLRRAPTAPRWQARPTGHPTRCRTREHRAGKPACPHLLTVRRLWTVSPRLLRTVCRPAPCHSRGHQVAKPACLHLLTVRRFWAVSPRLPRTVCRPAPCHFRGHWAGKPACLLLPTAQRFWAVNLRLLRTVCPPTPRHARAHWAVKPACPHSPTTHPLRKPNCPAANWSAAGCRNTPNSGGHAVGSPEQPACRASWAAGE